MLIGVIFTGLKSLNNCRRNYSSKTTLLTTFSEYEKALNFINNCNYSLASPLLMRVYDIIISAVGYNSPMAINTLLPLVESLYYNNQIEKCYKILLNHKDKINKSDEKSFIISQHLCKYYFLNGKIDNCYENSLKSIKLLENSSIQLNENLYHTSYGYIGLCNLLNKQNDYAEMNLQRCARWSFNKSNDLVSLNNLGCYHWLQINRQLWRNNQIFSNDPLPNIKQFDDQINARTKALEAIEYWEEAIVNAFKENNQVSSSEMCGPNINPTILTPSVQTNVPVQETSLFLNKGFAEAYLTILCNLYEAYESIGENTKAYDYLVSAIKIIDKYPQTSPNFFGVVSRVRGLLGLSMLFQNNPISSEGMFRSSLECYDKYPHLLCDVRNQYGKAITLGSYGKLLLHWEKREKHGIELMESSKLILTTLQSYQDNTFKLSQSILLPEITEID